MKNIAVITGASSGMGKEFAIQVAQKYDFDEIWIVARRLDNLNALAQQINQTKNFQIVKPVKIDLGSRNGVAQLDDLEFGFLVVISVEPGLGPQFKFFHRISFCVIVQI